MACEGSGAGCLERNMVGFGMVGASLMQGALGLFCGLGFGDGVMGGKLLGAGCLNQDLRDCEGFAG